MTLRLELPIWRFDVQLSMRLPYKLMALVALVALAYSALPFPRPGDSGYYTWAGYIWCTDHASCVHEVGHMLDDRAGWVSQSAAFRNEIATYFMVSFMPSPEAPAEFNVFTQLANPNALSSSELKEFYANLLEDADGDPAEMAPGFRSYYNWSLAARLIREYVPRRANAQDR